MHGCICRLLVIFVVALVPALGVFLALQPVGVTAPLIQPEGATRFDQKAALLFAQPAGSPDEIRIPEGEINAKLAQMVPAAPVPLPLTRVFLRLHPENGITTVTLGEVLGREVGVVTELRLVSGDGVTVTVESARLGALPLPVSLFTRILFPALEGVGVPIPSLIGLLGSLTSARVDGTSLIISR